MTSPDESEGNEVSVTFKKKASVEVPPMDSSKIAFAAHLERKFDTGKCSTHF